MRIGIDARLLERKVSGLGRILDRVLRVLPEVDGQNTYVLFCQDGLQQYENMGFRVIRIGKMSILPPKLYSPVWLNAVLPSYLKSAKVDVFFSPNSFLPLEQICCMSVALIPDVLIRLDKLYFSMVYRSYAGLMQAHSVKKSNAIITISRCSQKDIVQFYGVSESKITVIHLAADERFCPRLLSAREKGQIQAKYNLPNRFVLYVGVIDNRKNIFGILRIADFLKRHAKDIAIVLVGGPGSGFRKLSREIGKCRNVRYLSYVEDEYLPFIYNLADVFLFPSFYEGFGLPPLEAMQSGVPVVTSNVSSLPEVVGEGGIMHPPTDCEGMGQSIVRLLNDHEFREHMRQKALVQAGRFSWLKTANNFVMVFRNLS